MLENCASKITSFFIAKKWIEPTDKELSNYMLQCKIMSFTSMVILLLIGSLFQGVTSTFLFLFCFMSARKRAGGFHMGTPWKCLLTSIITECLLFVFVIPLLILHSVLFSVILLAFSLITFRIIGTVNHPSMQLTNKEIVESSKRLFNIAITQAVVAIFILIFVGGKSHLSLFIATGLACAAFSTILAKAIGQEVKQSHEQAS